MGLERLERREGEVAGGEVKKTKVDSILDEKMKREYGEMKEEEGGILSGKLGLVGIHGEKGKLKNRRWSKKSSSTSGFT